MPGYSYEGTLWGRKTRLSHVVARVAARLSPAEQSFGGILGAFALDVSCLDFQSLGNLCLVRYQVKEQSEALALALTLTPRLRREGLGYGVFPSM